MSNEQLEFDLIVKEYEQSTQRNPNFPYSWFNRGNTLAMSNDYRNAIANYNKAIELNKDFAEAYFNRGLCKIRIGENDSGVADLSKAGEMGIYVAYNIIKRFREKD
jgi:tetratricopeptide (TPR) repeat protein